MALTPGTRLGVYEVVSQIGAGGMGEVYRATDTNLKRAVALKVLPASLAADAERLARFQREAEVLAALNHPNIAAIYGLERSGATTALVMELVEGEDLSQRTARGAIPIDETLPIAKQIADALEAAHEQGFIHRDLKPANIKVRADGRVKVLDFGLAKAMESAGSMSPSASMSPTITSAAMTGAGMILGTPAYMSPEQAKGRAADKRTDIWAFGCVLYEMLTGRPLFGGESVSEVIAEVLKEAPDLSAVPPRVRPLVAWCLEKDPRARLRDIADARRLLDGPASAAIAPAAAASNTLLVALAAVALVSTIVAATLAVVHHRDRTEVSPTVRFEIPGEGPATSGSLTVSPDGRFLAFSAEAQGRRVVRLRALDAVQTRTIPDSTGVGPLLAWSPDSRFLLFSIQGWLRKADVNGGPPAKITSVGSASFANWTRDGTIFFVGASGLNRVPDTGGTTTTLAQSGTAIVSVRFLPDERHFLFSAGDRYISGTTIGIYAGSLDQIDALASTWKTSRALATADSPDFAFVPLDDRRGYIVFGREGALTAQLFDTVKLDALGPPETIANDISVFAASSNVLAYRTGDSQTVSQLRLFDRHGNAVGTVGEPGSLFSVDIGSDDKESVVVGRIDSGTSHVYLGDTARGVFSRLTSTDANEGGGTVGPDGSVFFTSTRPGAVGDLFVVRPASAEPRLLAKSEFVKHPNDVSPDGNYLIYDVHTSERQDLFVLPLNTPNAAPIPFLATAADETSAVFSPDGQWVAYSSDESSRREVYVRAFLAGQVPMGGARKQVSTAGGDKPRWSRDGKELFYIDAARMLIAVPVVTGTTFQVGLQVPLFECNVKGFRPYDVTRDGRFLFNTPLSTASDRLSPITVVVNWTAALKK